MDISKIENIVKDFFKGRATVFSNYWISVLTAQLEMELSKCPEVKNGNLANETGTDSPPASVDKIIMVKIAVIHDKMLMKLVKRAEKILINNRRFRLQPYHAQAIVQKALEKWLRGSHDGSKAEQTEKAEFSSFKRQVLWTFYSEIESRKGKIQCIYFDERIHDREEDKIESSTFPTAYLDDKRYSIIAYLEAEKYYLLNDKVPVRRCYQPIRSDSNIAFESELNEDRAETMLNLDWTTLFFKEKFDILSQTAQ